MKLAFEVLKAQTKLEIGARAASNPDLLADVMREVAADLHAAVEEFTPLWGELTGIVKQLEKGKGK